jgi:hypothetical protein
MTNTTNPHHLILSKTKHRFYSLSIYIKLKHKIMLFNESNLQGEENSQPASNVQNKAMEGEGMGGHSFGKDGKSTPMGDDKDNPSRMAGYSNGYFARTAPSDEDTANNNFKAAHQQGEPDYDKAQRQPNIPGPQEVPDQQKVGEDNDNKQEQQYQEPELGEQQPDHGSNDTETGEEKEHIET